MSVTGGCFTPCTTVWFPGLAGQSWTLTKRIIVSVFIPYWVGLGIVQFLNSRFLPAPYRGRTRPSSAPMWGREEKESSGTGLGWEETVQGLDGAWVLAQQYSVQTSWPRNISLLCGIIERKYVGQSDEKFTRYPAEQCSSCGRSLITIIIFSLLLTKSLSVWTFWLKCYNLLQHKRFTNVCI